MATFSTSFAIDMSDLTALNVLTGYPNIYQESANGFKATKGSLTATVAGFNFVWPVFGDVPDFGTMQSLSIAGGLLTSFSFTGLDLSYLSFRSTLLYSGVDAALALLLNGQIFSAILNVVLIVPCILLGFLVPLFWAVPSAHGVLAIYMKREDRKHEEIVDAIRRHGPPPGFKP